MKQGKPSGTAEGLAALRAAEWLAPEDQRTCHDRFARDFIGTRYRIISKNRHLTRTALWCIERIVPGIACYLVGRAGYVDGYLETCINDGIEQLVILGAGYDSRAYRFESLKGNVRVFEVDHPSTQRSKTAKVRRVLGSLPEHVVYVPIDLNESNLAQGLSASGYDSSRKTLFIWEGVVSYLTPEAVDETLAFVAHNSGEGSSIIFDYLSQSALDARSDIEQVNRMRKAYVRVVERLTSERFSFAVEDGTIERFLSERGFCDVVDVSGDSFRCACYPKPNPSARVFGTVHATVKPRSQAA